MAEDGKDEEKTETEVTPEEEEEEEQDVCLKVAELQFACVFAHKVGDKQEEERIRNELMPLYEKNNMIEFYKKLQIDTDCSIDSEFVSSMEANALKELTANEEKQEEIKKTEGDVEVLENMLERCKIVGKCRSFSEALKLYDDSKLKALTTGKSIDKHLGLLRLCLAWNEDHTFKKYAEISQKLIDKGGDWDRRNRYIVYNGVHYFRIRNFEMAAKGFLDAISTFTANEIFNYERLVYYTIIAAIVSLPRTQIKEKLIDSPEILQIIDNLPILKSFLNSFYECRYNEFFRSLIELMNTFIRKDFYLSLHASYYLKKIRLRAYDQFLQSYQSVKLQTMAKAFGVSIEFLDGELSSYIASNELSCKIDKVNGIVEIHQTNERNSQYHEVIKRGDALLSRIQRLSRILTY